MSGFVPCQCSAALKKDCKNLFSPEISEILNSKNFSLSEEKKIANEQNETPKQNSAIE